MGIPMAVFTLIITFALKEKGRLTHCFFNFDAKYKLQQSDCWNCGH